MQHSKVTRIAGSRYVVTCGFGAQTCTGSAVFALQLAQVAALSSSLAPQFLQNMLSAPWLN
jgi:hypothetical protein